VLDSLASALATLQLPPNRVVVVTDIGCIGISDRHFRVHTFHGLHGRSITYACGLKLADPGLHVVVLVGDGGLGIGGHHFLHAARRNVDLTVLVCNNFNFGMTGGQHSVTTPHEAITATTSAGNFEHPLDVTGLVEVAGGNFAARLMYHDKSLPAVISRAISTPGFAAVEVWEMCTAYFAKRNRANRAYLQACLEEDGLETGILVSRTRPDYMTQYRKGLKTLEGAPASWGLTLEPEFAHAIEGRTTLMIAGRAGQKVRSSAILLGRAAALSDLHVAQRDEYPVTVMTGHSNAEMILQTTPVHALGVDVPDYVVLTAPEGLAHSREKLRGLDRSTVVYSVPELLPLDTGARVEVIPTGELGVAAKRTQVVLASVGWFVKQTGLLSLDALRRSAALDAREAISRDNLATLDRL